MLPMRDFSSCVDFSYFRLEFISVHLLKPHLPASIFPQTQTHLSITRLLSFCLSRFFASRMLPASIFHAAKSAEPWSGFLLSSCAQRWPFVSRSMRFGLKALFQISVSVLVCFAGVGTSFGTSRSSLVLTNHFCSSRVHFFRYLVNYLFHTIVYR